MQIVSDCSDFFWRANLMLKLSMAINWIFIVHIGIWHILIWQVFFRDILIMIDMLNWLFMVNMLNRLLMIDMLNRLIMVDMLYRFLMAVIVMLSVMMLKWCHPISDLVRGIIRWRWVFEEVIRWFILGDFIVLVLIEFIDIAIRVRLFLIFILLPLFWLRH